MYPPNAQYSSVPTDVSDLESSVYESHHHHHPLMRLRTTLRGRRKLFRAAAIASGVIVLLLLFKQGIRHRSPEPIFQEEEPVRWSPGDLTFADAPKPPYLDKPPISSRSTPLTLRLAIVSRVDELETRQALRDTMLEGISRDDVRITYRFFVGRMRPGDERMTWSLWWDLFWERWVRWDVVTLWDLDDVKDRLSEKRYRALKWADSVSPDQYDYAMSLDSDTFCRFRALARRLAHNHPTLRPASQPILIGRMGTHLVYFENTVPDGNINDAEEDYHIKGPWYQFPIGFGYMLSSNLTRTLMSTSPPLPHHVNFPSDDVMIGSWIAGLRNMHDPSAEFYSVLPPPSPSSHNTYRNATYHPPGTRVRPLPYLPYRLETTLVDDKTGWHDFRGRGDNDAGVGWESVCVHRMNLAEMRAFRELEDVKGEWGG